MRLSVEKKARAINTLASAHNGALPWVGGIASEKNIECFLEETCKQ